MTALIRILAIGLIMVVWSEFWFYPVTVKADSWIVLPFYAFAVAILVTFLARYPKTGWPGVIVAAGLMGLAIEGVAVPVIYEAPPFTLVWTSLAWHMLISFGFGVVGMRWAMRQPISVMVPVLVVAGFLLGLWGGYFWSASEEEIGNPYWLQLWGGFVAVVIGHLILDATAARENVGSRVGVGATAVLVLGLWGMAWGITLFPISVIFPAFYALTWWCFRRAGQGPDRTGWIYGHPLGLSRYPWMLLLPLAAWGGYFVSYGQLWELNTWWIIVTGPVATLPWLWAHGVMLLGRPSR